MKPLLANTLFTRLLALIVVSVVISHILTFGLLFMFANERIAPPPPFPLPAFVRGAPNPDGNAHLRTRPMRERPPAGGFVLAASAELIALALAAWFSAKLIARPIQQLSQAATELGDNVDRAPIEEAGTVEARQAARAFNRMQARLRAQIAARARFLAAVSHDLRTPLTRMRLRVERLAPNDISEKLRDDVLEMSAMLDATLDYLRGESQSEAPRLLDVVALVSSLAEDYQEQGLQITVGGGAQPIVAQPLALRRCLANLMENALRYGKQASVDVHDEGKQLIIEIRDRGEGIPADQLEAVMEPFYRLESSRNRATGGVGLGLSIAREAIQRQGGSLSLRNADERGLVATLSLPRKGELCERVPIHTG